MVTNYLNPPPHPVRDPIREGENEKGRFEKALLSFSEEAGVINPSIGDMSPHCNNTTPYHDTFDIDYQYFMQENH